MTDWKPTPTREAVFAAHTEALRELVAAVEDERAHGIGECTVDDQGCEAMGRAARCQYCRLTVAVEIARAALGARHAP